jgi:ribosomal protein S18 acetylase RimI-like enzyme
MAVTTDTISQVEVCTDSGNFDSIILMAKDYCEESGYDYTFSAKITYDSLMLYMQSEDADILYLPDKGFAVVTIERLWCEESHGHLFMLYVKPEHRSFKNAAALIDSSLKLMKTKGVKYAFASTVSEVSNRATKAFGLMMMRRGFYILSPNFMKELD